MRDTPFFSIILNKLIVFLVLIMFLPSCADVYQVQIGDIDDRESFEPTPFMIRVSETGVNLEELGKIAQALRSQVMKGTHTCDNRYIRLIKMGIHNIRLMQNLHH